MLNGTLRTALLSLAIAIFALVSPVASANDSSMQALKGELVQMQRQFIGLQRETLQNHADLKNEQQSLQALTEKKLASAGFDDDAKSRIKQLKKQLQNPSASEQEKQSAKQEMGELARSFKGARMVIAKDKELLVAKQNFQKKLLDTMQKEHPQLPQLLQQMKSKSQALKQKISQSAQSSKDSAEPQ